VKIYRRGRLEPRDGLPIVAISQAGGDKRESWELERKGVHSRELGAKLGSKSVQNRVRFSGRQKKNVKKKEGEGVREFYELNNKTERPQGFLKSCEHVKGGIEREKGWGGGPQSRTETCKK